MGLPVHFTMHLFRVGVSLSLSLVGTAVDEITMLGGWKAGPVTKHHIGPATSLAMKGIRLKLDADCGQAGKFPFSAGFTQQFVTCARR